MKKRVLIFGLIVSLLLFVVAINPSSFKYLNLEETNDLVGYCAELAEINEKYIDNYDSRIIVKTKIKLNDNDYIYKASGFNGLNVLQYKNGEDAENALNYYKSLEDVEYASLDREIHTTSIEDNRLITNNMNGTNYLSWGADLLGVGEYQDYLINKYKNGNMPDIYVGVIDTGIDTDNEFLKGRIAFEYGFSCVKSLLKTGYDYEDDNTHGTHVSGTIVDLTLDNVKIIPLKVLNNEGRGSTSNIISAMEYLIKLKNEDNLNIVATNMSIGGVGTSNDVIKAVNDLYDNNIMPVVAAGNDNYYVEEYGPANTEKALTISALQKNTSKNYKNTLHLAYYSNYGSCIDLCLPGSEIVSCVPQKSKYASISSCTGTGNKYGRLSGTSMATPHATAMVALYATYYADAYDVQTVEKEIKQNTYDFGSVGRDDLYGNGVPCMKFAIQKDNQITKPTISVGNLNGEYHFDNSLQIKINDNSPSGSYNHKIYYTTDGTLPTLVSYNEYSEHIDIDCSTFLRFVIYSFDKYGNFAGRSDLYEATYYKGASSVNDDGTGFVIDSQGRVKKYTSGLKNIVLPEYINNIKVKTLCSELFYGNNIESFVCEQDVKIESYPFSNCGQLKYIKLNSSTADYIANYCFGLEELVLPNVTQIKESFLNYIYLGELNGSRTFAKCFNIKSIYAPNVREIKDYTYSYMKRLENLVLDWDNITELGEYSFECCENLSLSLVLSDNITTIPQGCFKDSKITSIVANGVTEIIKWAFCDCEYLTNVSFGELVSIGDYAFYSSAIVGGIKLANNSTIGDDAFYLCESLECIDLNNCVSIGKGAFEFCKSLTEVSLKSCTSVGDNAFQYCNKLKTVENPNITEISKNCFFGCSDLESFDFSNVQFICDSAFYNCLKLKEISLVNVIELKCDNSLSEYSKGSQFRNCDGLTTVELGENIKTIPNGCFEFCNSLKNIDLSKVTKIETAAFRYCRALEIIDLSNIESLGLNVFSGIQQTAKVIINKNQNLILSDEPLGLNVERVYISKEYSGKFGKYLQENFRHACPDTDEDYIIYGKYPYFNLTIKFKDGTIINQYRLSSKDNISSSLPSYYESDDGYSYNITSWKSNVRDGSVYSYSRLYLSSDETITADRTVRINRVNFYYNIDFDGSGIINDEGDIFETLKIINYYKIAPKKIMESFIFDHAKYIFVGWEYNGILYKDNADLPNATGNMDFYATYKKIPEKCKITWYGQNGEFLYSDFVNYGETPKFKLYMVVIKELIINFNIPSIKEYKEYKNLVFENVSPATNDTCYYAK
ncbi:MAG: leucine-rich repeat protein [Clostridia bacterium]|nr:leucine-rich repeat protein [Clostridia bacterium]